VQRNLDDLASAQREAVRNGQEARVSTSTDASGSSRAEPLLGQNGLPIPGVSGVIEMLPI
jgi:hypothetical protein